MSLAYSDNYHPVINGVWYCGTADSPQQNIESPLGTINTFSTSSWYSFHQLELTLDVFLNGAPQTLFQKSFPFIVTANTIAITPDYIFWMPKRSTFVQFHIEFTVLSIFFFAAPCHNTFPCTFLFSYWPSILIDEYVTTFCWISLISL